MSFSKAQSRSELQTHNKLAFEKKLQSHTATSSNTIKTKKNFAEKSGLRITFFQQIFAYISNNLLLGKLTFINSKYRKKLCFSIVVFIFWSGSKCIMMTIEIKLNALFKDSKWSSDEIQIRCVLKNDFKSYLNQTNELVNDKT